MSSNKYTLKIRAVSRTETMIRNINKLINEPVFGNVNAEWVSELPSVIGNFNETIHNSTKTTPIQAS